MIKIFAIASLAALGAPAAAVQFVANGGFEQTNMADPSGFGNRYPTGVVNGWSGDGLIGIYFPGTAETGTTTEYGYRDLKVYGPGNGHANGLPATSPVGGNFVVLDGDTSPGLRGRVSQQLSGLVAGDRYKVSFWFAGAQQLNFGGATFDKYLDVSLGDATQRTEALAGPEASFQPWRKASMIFTAATGTETLSFLAHGQPNGLPPLVLLDGVSVRSAVPEPATWAMLIVGFGMVGFASRRRGGLVRVAA